MRYIGIDLGTRRIGLAFGDELGVATPLPALTQADEGQRRAGLLKVIRERRADEIVIGHPLNMDDSAGPKAKEPRRLRRCLARSWANRFTSWTNG
jgi:putative Holliday junction resolvase